MKKLLFLLLFFGLTLCLAACDNDQAACAFDESDTIKICATLFPQYDFARQVGGDKVDVKLLLKPGVEPHSYQPTAKDIVNLNRADLFIYTNPVMEPWVTDKILNAIERDIKVINISQNLHLIEADHDHHEHEDEDDHHHGDDYDPHVWTSIHNAIKMIETIRDELILLDSENQSYYEANAVNYINQLRTLDQEFQTLFSNSKHRTIVHAGHSAMGYFAHDYDLTIVTAYSTFSPNEELKLENIKNLIQITKTYQASVIYHEELINAKTAKMIQDELKKDGVTVELRLLHGLHNISEAELKSKLSYYDLMKQNLENLKAGFQNDLNR